MTEAMYDLMYIIDTIVRDIKYLTITIGIWVYLWKGKK